MRVTYVGYGQAFPGFEQPTRAPWPVWKGTANVTKSRIKPAPAMSRDAAARYYRGLEDLEGRTRLPGRQDGVIGRNGLAVARSFLWGFLNWRTGRLDPSYEAIAKRAHISPRSVAKGIQKLKDAGVLHWVRRCIETTDEAGRFALVQISNLYAFRSMREWIGAAAEDETTPAEPPPPDAIDLGLAPPPIERGTEKAGTFDRDYELIEQEALAAAGDPLAIVLARGMRDRMEAEQASSSGLQPLHRNPTVIYN